MSKKKLFILPVIVLVIVSIMSIAVLAVESPDLNLYKVKQRNGKGADITNKFNGEQLYVADGFDLSKIDGIQKEVKAIDKNLKISDFAFKFGVEIEQKPTFDNVGPGGTPWKVSFPAVTVPKGYAAVMVHVSSTGKVLQHRVFVGDGKAENAYIDGVDSTSPFYLYIANKKSSAQTGDYAPLYVAMISVGLITFGAFFAIRAKKETK